MDTLKKVGENGDIGPRHDARSSSKRGAADGVGAQMKKVGEKLGKKGRGDVSPQVEERSVAGNILRVDSDEPPLCLCVCVCLFSVSCKFPRLSNPVSSVLVFVSALRVSVCKTLCMSERANCQKVCDRRTWNNFGE